MHYIIMYFLRPILFIIVCVSFSTPFQQSSGKLNVPSVPFRRRPRQCFMVVDKDLTKRKQ